MKVRSGDLKSDRHGEVGHWDMGVTEEKPVTCPLCHARWHRRKEEAKPRQAPEGLCRTCQPAALPSPSSPCLGSSMLSSPIGTTPQAALFLAAWV